MSKIPRPLLVFLVLFGGSLLVYFAQKPQSMCDTQVETFREAEKGFLYRRTEKGIQDHNPIYVRVLGLCRQRAVYGACFEYFALMKRINRDLDGTPGNCSVEFSELPEVRKVLRESIEVLVSLAWGDKPPNSDPSEVMGPLQSADLVLFCQSRKHFLRMYGDEAFAQLRNYIYGVLPGEPIERSDSGECKNCANRKRATEVFSSEEIWKRSLFVVPCERYM